MKHANLVYAVVLLFCFSCFAPLLYASCITDEKEPVTTLSRRLVGVKDAPISKARVSVKDPAKNVVFSAESDKKGNFRIRGLQPGTYLVHIDAGGYIRHRYTLVVSKHMTKGPSALHLLPQSECHDVIVNPVDEQRD